MVNDAVPVPVWPPLAHCTVAMAGPGVRVAGVHVHDTWPRVSAVSLVVRDVLRAVDPEAYRTLTVHVAPADVVAVTVVCVPSLVGFGSTETATRTVPGCASVVGTGVPGAGVAT